MATEESVPAANVVAEAFVEQYFILLSQKPQEAHRVYVDASVVSRPGLDGTMTSFTSVEFINKHFLSCDYENATFELLSLDSQNSLEDGIFIMVIGFFTGKDNLKRKFSQMFYLARQNNVYVVLNDIFRFVDEEASTPITLPVVESATEVAEPADELNKTEPIHKIDVSAENSVNAAEVKNVSVVKSAAEVKNVSEVKSAAEVKKAVAGVTPPVDNGKIKHSEEKVVTAQKPAEPVAETVAAPQTDGAKKSFAAIVQSMARNAAPFQNKAPAQKPKYTGQTRAAAPPQAHASVSNSEKKYDQKIVEEPGTSIFVANLPMNAMPPQVHELFKDFGPIKENGVQIRSTRGSGTCYGFVAFESVASVQSVLQTAKNTPFMLADRKLRVKEKQVDYDGSKPSGRSGGGNKTQNGSADGGDEFRRPRNRRNSGKNERRGDRNATNGDNNQKSNEGAPEVQA